MLKTEYEQVFYPSLEYIPIIQSICDWYNVYQIYQIVILGLNNDAATKFLVTTLFYSDPDFQWFQ